MDHTVSTGSFCRNWFQYLCQIGDEHDKILRTTIRILCDPECDHERTDEETQCDNEILDKVEEIEGHLGEDEMTALGNNSTVLTDDLVLEGLIFTNRLPIPFTLMVFAIEILDSLIIEQAVRVNATSDLEDIRSSGNKDMAVTYHITFIHLTSHASAVPCQNDTSDD